MFNFFVSKTDKIIEEVMDKAYNPDLRDDDISQLNDVEKVIFIVNVFNMEVLNGGVCQFFSNSSGEYAPFISECLEKIGSLENQKLFEDFVIENNINLNDLSVFKTSDVHDYSYRVCKLYDYEKFDANYVEIDDELAKYIKKHYK